MATFLAQEAAGGILLIAAAAVALALANSPLGAAYARLLHAPVGPLPIELWVNDALMAVFFLTVGLEVKREFVEGDLSHEGARALPIAAAVAGMAAPALLYLAIAGDTPGAARGWAIPAATDIAFAQAVLLLAGRGLPQSLKLFLTTIAIVDDIGAIAIIAIAYTARIDLGMLVLALGIVAGLALLNRRGVRRLAPYLLLGGLLWIAVFRSGIHATVAGVVTAMFVPLAAREGETPPLHRLEAALHPWSAFLIVPIFGLANAGLNLAGFGIGDLLRPIPVGIALGLFVGKQLGVGAGMALAIRLGFGRAPEGASSAQLYGVALLAGIGFTMSLFIGGLAFPDAGRLEEVKLGVLGGSILSALIGFAVLRLSTRRPPLSPRAPRP